SADSGVLDAANVAASAARAVLAEAMDSVAKPASQALSAAAAVLARATVVGQAVDRWALAVLVQWDQVDRASAAIVVRVVAEVHKGPAAVAECPARAALGANRSAMISRATTAVLRPTALGRRRASRLASTIAAGIA